MGRNFISSGGYGGRTGVIGVPSSAAVTIAAWFYPTAAAGNNFTIAGFGPSVSGGYEGLGITDSSGNYIFNAFQSNGTENDANTGPTLSLKTWHLGVMTCSGTGGTGLKCYTDGGNLATTTGLSVASLNTFNIGALTVNGSVTSRATVAYWCGEVAVWSTALLAAEIADMYYSRRPLGTYRQMSLWGYWPLRGGAAGVEPDASGNGRHLTLTGNPPQANHPPIVLADRLHSGYLSATASRLVPTPPVNDYAAVWAAYRSNPFDLLP
jgi:hypothetical protein